MVIRISQLGIKKGKKMAIKPKKYDRQSSERRLMKAAEEVFSKEGFKGATTRAIAKKAGLNIANIAHYFGDKEGLLMRILEEEITSTLHRELNYPIQGALLDELLKYSNSSFDYFLQKISLIKIITGHFMTNESFHKKFHQTITILVRNQELESRLEILLKENKMSNQIPTSTIIDDIDDQIVMLILSAIILRAEPEIKVRESLARYVRIYCEFLKVT